jgi:pyruvate dehydrogenase E1 component beta subunit
MARMTFQQACVSAIADEMERDENIFVLGEDVGRFGGPLQSTSGLYERFGTERVIDMPISEGTIVGAAIGAALEGKRPIVDLMFLEFLPLIMQQLFDAGAMHYYSAGAARAPIVVRAKYGVGPFHGHAYDLHSWAVSLPGVKVVAPSAPADAMRLMKAAIRDNNPVLFLEHMGLYHAGREETGAADDSEVLGRAVVKKCGSDVTIVASALMTRRALQAAEALELDGVSAEIVDLRTISPLDEKTILDSVRKTGRLVVASEAVKQGGSHNDVAALVAAKAFDALVGSIEIVAPPPVPVPFHRVLEKAYVPDVNDIVRAARQASRASL